MRNWLSLVVIAGLALLIAISERDFTAGLLCGVVASNVAVEIGLWRRRRS